MRAGVAHAAITFSFCFKDKDTEVEIGKDGKRVRSLVVLPANMGPAMTVSLPRACRGAYHSIISF